MTLKAFARLSAYSLIVGLVFVVQKAYCLPFWDSATNYPVPPGSGGINGSFVNLNGLINPEGNAWSRVGTNQTLDVEVINYPLSYPGLECSASNSFLFGDITLNAGYSERVAIHPAMLAGNTYTGASLYPGGGSITNAYVMNSDTIYYSFIFQIPELGALPTTGAFICGFDDEVGYQSQAITVANARIYFELNGTTNYQAGIGANPSGPTVATYLPTLYNTNSTNFVVCSYTFVPGNNGSNNYAQMWLNPDPSTFGAAVPPPPSATNNNNGGSLGVGASAVSNIVMSFYFRQANSSIPLVCAADLRIGYCWACVTPPAVNPAPQPATLSIAAASTNLAVISFQTNTPCYLMQNSTNITYTSNTWPLISTAPALVGTNFVVTNATSVSVVTTNVVMVGTNLSTNFSTNTVFPPTYYQAKTYAN